MPAAGSLLTAVETNTRSPHTIGLDTATPGTGVFQRMFSPVAAFHFTAVRAPSATPDAPRPRNDGQFCADSTTPASRQLTKNAARRATSFSLGLAPARPRSPALLACLAPGAASRALGHVPP